MFFFFSVSKLTTFSDNLGANFRKLSKVFLIFVKITTMNRKSVFDKNYFNDFDVIVRKKKPWRLETFTEEVHILTCFRQIIIFKIF